MPFLTRIKHFLKSIDIYTACFVLIFLLSAIIRFRPVIDGTFPYLYDHGRDMLDVRKIVVDHNFTLIGPTTGLPGIFHGPVHYYLLAIGFLLSGGHPASGVTMVVLAQLLGGLLCYYLGSRFFSKSFGFILSLIYLLAYGSITVSAMFWNPYWIPVLLVIFYFAVLGALQKNSRYWLLAGLVAGLIAQFEIAFGAFLIPYMFIVGILFAKKFYKNIYFWGSFLFFFVAFIPLIAFDFRHGMLMTNTLSNILLGKNELLGDFIPMDLRFGYRINELTKATVFAVTQHPVVGYFMLGLSCLGVGYAAYKRNFESLKYYTIFGLLPVLVFAGMMVYTRHAWHYYWISLQVSYYFLLAYALYRLVPYIALQNILYVLD